MLSRIPQGDKKLSSEDLDKEILRVGMMAELDAVSLYEQMATATSDENLKKILLDIAKEEKTHVGEFEAMLLKRDKEQVEELKSGAEEVKEKTGE